MCSYTYRCAKSERLWHTHIRWEVTLKPHSTRSRDLWGNRDRVRARGGGWRHMNNVRHTQDHREGDMTLKTCTGWKQTKSWHLEQEVRTSPTLTKKLCNWYLLLGTRFHISPMDRMQGRSCAQEQLAKRKQAPVCYIFSFFWYYSVLLIFFLLLFWLMVFLRKRTERQWQSGRGREGKGM